MNFSSKGNAYSIVVSTIVAFAIVFLGAQSAFAVDGYDNWDNLAGGGWDNYSSSGWDNYASSGWDDYSSGGWDNYTGSSWDGYASDGWDNYSSSGWDDYSTSGWDNYASSGWDNYTSDGWDNYSSGGWDNFSSDGWDNFSSDGWDNFSSDGWDNFSSTGWDNFSSNGWDNFSSTGWDNFAGADTGYDVYDVYDVVDEYGVKYSYNDYGYESYSSGCGSSCGKSYTTPGCTSCNPVRVTPPPPVSYPPIVIPPSPPSRPSNNSTVVNTNTCTHNSCNTSVNNIDNSINGSFNTTAPVTPIFQPQPLAQYVFPQQGNFCVITASPSSVQSGQPTFLSWTSNQGVTSAWLSDGIGRVAPNGTLVARPSVSTNYVLTVQGYGGTYTCNTFVNVSGTYVSLTQIPYTGLDFGAMGTAIYWLGLISFAVSGAYLALYYKGGASIFAGSFFGGMKFAKSATKTQKTQEYASIAAPKMFAREARMAFTPAKAESRVLENLPVSRAISSPKDSIAFSKAENEQGTPRIVITRS